MNEQGASAVAWKEVGYRTLLSKWGGGCFIKEASHRSILSKKEE